LEISRIISILIHGTANHERKESSLKEVFNYKLISLLTNRIKKNRLDAIFQKSVQSYWLLFKSLLKIAQMNPLRKKKPTLQGK
jgi:hypothetical protein